MAHSQSPRRLRRWPLEWSFVVVVVVVVAVVWTTANTNLNNVAMAESSPVAHDLDAEQGTETSTTSTTKTTAGEAKDESDNVVTWEEDDNDRVEDSFYDPLQADPDCVATTGNDATDASSCWAPPSTTIEQETIPMDASCSFGGDDPDQDLASSSSTSTCDAEGQVIDKHWGSDKNILRMRNKLRDSGSGVSRLFQTNSDGGDSNTNRRPPVFLMPGLASTRLVAWRYKACSQHPLLSDIKVLDYGR